MDLRAIPDSEYQRFLDGLDQRPEGRGRLEIQKIGKQQMREAILAKQEEIERERALLLRNAQSKQSARHAFVDVHPRDAENAKPLLDYLRERHVIPLMVPPGSEATPRVRVKEFEETLRQAELLIVVFGEVQREWVDEHLDEAAKLVIFDRLPTKTGVYVAPPKKPPGADKFPGVYVMNNAGGFDRASLAPLLGNDPS